MSDYDTQTNTSGSSSQASAQTSNSFGASNADTSTKPQTDIWGAYDRLVLNNDKLEKRNKELDEIIREINSKLIKQNEFLDASANLSRIVFWMIIAIPLIILVSGIILSVVIWRLTGDSQNLNILVTAISLTGIPGIIGAFTYARNVGNRLKLMEEKLRNLEKESNQE